MDGWHGDSAVTVPVGEVEALRRRLLEVTRESLDLAIDEMRPGQRLSDIGHAVQSFVEPEGFLLRCFLVLLRPVPVLAAIHLRLDHHVQLGQGAEDAGEP